MITIVCLMALVVIIAREQMTGSVIAVEQARGTVDPASERAALEAIVRDDPHDTDALEQLAILAREDGRWMEAANQWAQIAKLDPLNADARFEEARNLLAAGDALAVISTLTDSGRMLSPPEQLLLARGQLMLGDIEAARSAAATALRELPDDPTTRLMWADIAFSDGDDETARVGYRALVNTPDTALAAQLGLAQIASRRGNADAAIEKLQRIAAPAPSQFLTARAALYRQLKRFDLAEADYRSLVDQNGPRPDAVVPLAELRAAANAVVDVRALRLSLTGTDTAALAAHHYLQAIEEYLDGNLESARDFLAWSADIFGGRDLYRWMQLDVGARLGDAALATLGVRSLQKGLVGKTRLLRIASLLAGQAAEQVDAGQTATASALATLALEVLPEFNAATIVLARVALLDNDSEQARVLAAGLVQDQTYGTAALEVLGRAALAAGDIEQAQAWFASLAAAMPDTATGVYWQGVAAFEAGDLAASVDYLRQAYQRRKDPRVESALIDVLIRQQSYAEAEALAREVIASPEAADAARGHAFLGGVRRAQDRRTEAAVSYTQAAETDPARYPYALAGADLLMELERFDEAQRLLDAAARRYPDNRYVAFKQALLAQRAGHDQDAVHRYRALMRNQSDWALPMVNLSELLAAEEGNRAEAVSMAERAADLAPRWADARWNLAQRKADVGARGEALRAARQVLELAPEHAGAKAMIASLDGKP